jgi:hypothetical protein
MASLLHEMLVELIAECPEILLPALHEHLGEELAGVELGFHRGESTHGQLPPLRADLTLELRRAGTIEPFAAITVEAQLGKDPDKPFSWLFYHAGLHHRLRVPCFLVVVATDPEVAAWAAGPFHSGMVMLRPWVIGPANVPAITDPEVARRSLSLTLLSGIVHGNEPVAVDIGLALAAALDAAPDDVGLYYWDGLLAALGDAIREALEMQLRNFKPRSEWGRNLLAKGEADGLAKGEAAGRAKSILELLDARGLSPDATLRQRIVACTDLAVLERWFRRATTASSLDEAFAP